MRETGRGEDGFEGRLDDGDTFEGLYHESLSILLLINTESKLR